MKKPKYATPFIDLFRPLTPSEASDLTESIKVQGVIHPVVVYTSPTTGPSIIDGLNRWSIADELKVDCPVDDRGELDDDTARELAEDLNMSRRHLSGADWQKMRESRDDRIKRVAKARAKGKTTRQIAKDEGISQPQVISDMKAAADKGLSAEMPEKVVGIDGKKQPSTKPPRPKSTSKVDPPKGEEAAEDAEPVHQADAFVDELEGFCREIDQLCKRMAELKKSPFARDVHIDAGIAQIAAVRKQLWVARPDHDCPYCKGGSNKSECKVCNSTGRVCRGKYERGVAAVGGDAA